MQRSSVRRGRLGESTSCVCVKTTFDRSEKTNRFGEFLIRHPIVLSVIAIPVKKKQLADVTMIKKTILLFIKLA